MMVLIQGGAEIFFSKFIMFESLPFLRHCLVMCKSNSVLKFSVLPVCCLDVSTRNINSDAGYNTMSSSASRNSAGVLHHHDSFVSLPPTQQPFSLATSAAASLSMVSTPAAKLSASSGAAAAAATEQTEAVSDAQSKSKGKGA